MHSFLVHGIILENGKKTSTMSKNLLTIIFLLFLSYYVKAQSVIQIVSSSREPIYIVLQNPNEYFEESGDNITICNLAPANYILSFAQSLDTNAIKKEINISIPVGQKWIFNIGNDLRIDKSVVIIPTKSTNTNITNTPPAPTPKPKVRLHLIAKEDFDQLLASVRKQPFDSEKTKLIVPAAKYAAFTSEQIAQLLSSFQFDNKKLEFAQNLFPNAIDKENYNKVCGAFTFPNYCNQLMDFVTKQ